MSTVNELVEEQVTAAFGFAVTRHWEPWVEGFEVRRVQGGVAIRLTNRPKRSTILKPGRTSGADSGSAK